MQEVFTAGKIKREEVFIATKLWNNNHRPERVKPAFEASLKKLQLDYVDLYLIHTPFAFQPGDEQDPRDANGNVIYDKGVTLLDTWSALGESSGRGQVQGYRIIRHRPGRIQTGRRSSKRGGSSLQWFTSNRIRISHNGNFWTIAERMASCCKRSQALGHSMCFSNLLEDPVITAIAKRVNKTPAQVLLAWAIQRGTALLTTSKTPSRIKENFEVSTLPEEPSNT